MKTLKAGRITCVSFFCHHYLRPRHSFSIGEPHYFLKMICHSKDFCYLCTRNGVLAQLVERLNGIQKVRSSILLCSTKNTLKISKLQSLYTIPYTVVTSCVYFLLLSPAIPKPPRKPFPRWSEVYHIHEIFANRPRHTSANTQKNPAPHTKGRNFFALGPETWKED